MWQFIPRFYILCPIHTYIHTYIDNQRIWFCFNEQILILTKSVNNTTVSFNRERSQENTHSDGSSRELVPSFVVPIFVWVSHCLWLYRSSYNSLIQSIWMSLSFGENIFECVFEYVVSCECTTSSRPRSSADWSTSNLSSMWVRISIQIVHFFPR